MRTQSVTTHIVLISSLAACVAVATPNPAIAGAPAMAHSIVTSASPLDPAATGRAGLFMEDFETFSPGPISGVSGWTADVGGFVAQTGSQTGNPAEPTFGGASVAVNFDGSDGGFARSPSFGVGTGQFGLLESDVLIYEQSGGTTEIFTAMTPVDIVSGFINTRLLFSEGGLIEALQVSGGAGVFVATSGSWTLGTPTRIGIEVLPENVLNVYQDGSLIFSGHDIAQEINGSAGGVNAVRFETFTDNATGPKPYFDNIVMTARTPVGSTERVSVSTGGAQAASSSARPALSADGRIVAFHSSADNLVPGDGNFATDVFVHDRDTGVTERVSVSSAGVEGNSSSGEPVLSADGRYVAFSSQATNLVAGDNNFGTDVFVHDRQTGTTERVSVSSAGAEGSQSSFQASISNDGRYVSFHTTNGLDPADTNSATDVYVRDRQLGVTERVSVSSSGGQITFGSVADQGALSGDGRYVAFRSTSPDLVPGDTNSYDIFVHDRQTGTTELVSLDSAGVQANDRCDDPDISDDGRFVAFRSTATNLVLGDTSGVWYDVFVHDRQTGQTVRASVSSAGDEGIDTSGPPVLNADGTLVAFHSENDNFVDGDTNNDDDVFLHNLLNSTTTRVSVTTTDGQADAGAGVKPALSADGRYVAFSSLASNLVENDLNASIDIFVRDRGPACPSDIDGDGQTGGADLAILLAAWGSPGATDFTGDGVTDGADLAILLAAWGACAP